MTDSERVKRVKIALIERGKTQRDIALRAAEIAKEEISLALVNRVIGGSRGAAAKTDKVRAVRRATAHLTKIPLEELWPA